MRKAKETPRVTASMLRRLIKEEMNNSGARMSTAQAKVHGPLTGFVAHINGAKSELGKLFQQVSDQKASDQAQMLLNALDKIIKALDHMPELTRDPWHGVRNRGSNT